MKYFFSGLTPPPTFSLDEILDKLLYERSSINYVTCASLEDDKLEKSLHDFTFSGEGAHLSSEVEFLTASSFNAKFYTSNDFKSLIFTCFMFLLNPRPHSLIPKFASYPPPPDEFGKIFDDVTFGKMSELWD